jgi:hypothetical protein
MWWTVRITRHRVQTKNSSIPYCPTSSAQTWSYPTCSNQPSSSGVLRPASNPTRLSSCTLCRSAARSLFLSSVLRRARSFEEDGIGPEQAPAGAQREGLTGVDKDGSGEQHMCRLWCEKPRLVACAHMELNTCLRCDTGWASWSVSDESRRLNGIHRCTGSALSNANRGLISILAGHLPLHEMRRTPPKAGDAYLQSQIAEHGQMGQCASRCRKCLARESRIAVDECLEHEAHRQFRVEQDVQSSQRKSADPDRHRRG